MECSREKEVQVAVRHAAVTVCVKMLAWAFVITAMGAMIWSLLFREHGFLSVFLGPAFPIWVGGIAAVVVQGWDILRGGPSALADVPQADLRIGLRSHQEREVSAGCTALRSYELADRRLSEVAWLTITGTDPLRMLIRGRVVTRRFRPAVRVLVSVEENGETGSRVAIRCALRWRLIDEIASTYWTAEALAKALGSVTGDTDTAAGAGT